MIKISVIVLIHDVADYLEKCLKSLQNQLNFNDFEVLLLLDNATEEDKAIANKFLNDKRFKVFEVSFLDQGICRNFGKSKSIGEYIYFVDGDDYLENNCLENFYNKAIETNADIVVSNYYLEKGEKRHKPFLKIKNKYKFKNSFDQARVIYNDITLRGYFWNKLYKKEYLDRINVSSFKASEFIEDLCFNYFCFLNTTKISFLHSFNYTYVFRKGSSIHKKPILFIEKYLRTLAILRYYSYKNNALSSTNIYFLTKQVMLVGYVVEYIFDIHQDVIKLSFNIIRKISHIKKCDFSDYVNDKIFNSSVKILEGFHYLWNQG